MQICTEVHWDISIVNLITVHNFTLNLLYLYLHHCKINSMLEIFLLNLFGAQPLAGA
jgi:hypothetical protein